MALNSRGSASSVLLIRSPISLLLVGGLVPLGSADVAAAICLLLWTTTIAAARLLAGTALAATAAPTVTATVAPAGTTMMTEPADTALPLGAPWTTTRLLLPEDGTTIPTAGTILPRRTRTPTAGHTIGLRRLGSLLILPERERPTRRVTMIEALVTDGHHRNLPQTTPRHKIL